MLSHYQIWADFVNQGKVLPGGINNPNALDDDIIVIFEDDAVIAVKNVTYSLYNEISKMDVDLIFLGWCYGRRHMPMCTHAYALTRKGAKSMINNWDLCNKESIDGQWKLLAKDNVFTWRKAHHESYSALRDGFEDNPEYFTRGIFTQKNGLVSFNHHGFQNNAG
jgi:GR25 family glycosyltransferase involved in LPS biosynthesis